MADSAPGAGAARHQPVDRSRGAAAEAGRGRDRLVPAREPEVEQGDVESLSARRSDDPRTARRPETLLVGDDVRQVAGRLGGVDDQVAVVATRRARRTRLHCDAPHSHLVTADSTRLHFALNSLPLLFCRFSSPSLPFVTLISRPFPSLLLYKSFIHRKFGSDTETQQRKHKYKQDNNTKYNDQVHHSS